ncbi:PREDICTED: uncharacterized protein LOC107073558 [Polistes dominula]|uniref:Uncharacterized protein LOC107073558 n=1 Tax=Polistes dominula TaxID=743375 RepID=A0ABM1JB98_POLDO|nr:PREDICTED: uncharacterized protein LOC107073558 [Polistes dominula]
MVLVRDEEKKAKTTSSSDDQVIPQTAQPTSLAVPSTSTHGQGTRSRSQSPVALSTEFTLCVQAQREIFVSIQDILSQVGDPSESITLTEVNMLLEQLEELHRSFRQEHAQQVCNWPPNQMSHPYLTETVNISETKLMIKTKRLLGRLKEQLTQKTQPTSSPEDGARAHSRLPELTVPTFSGDCRKWPDFKAMFSSVIADRSDLSDLEKFQYLKSAMQGEAYEIVANITPDNLSFDSAWTLLTSRFENKRLIIKSHLERLLNLKPMQRRQATSLTKMVNIINETTQALRTLTVESNNDCLMVTLLTGLLDQDTRERWETSLASTDEFPTLSQLTEFLVTRARTLETIESSSTPAQPNVPKGAKTTRTSSYQASQQPPANSARSVIHQPSRPAQSRATYPCDCCGQDHYIAICQKMRSYSVK